MRAELIAEILEGKRQFSAARAALVEADELQPTAEHAHRLGLLAQRAGNDSQAVDDYETAVAREPDNLLYAESLGYAYRRAGRTREGEEIFERIVARYPDRVAAYRELAYTQLASGVRMTRRRRCVRESTHSWRRHRRQRASALPRRSLRCAQSTRRSPDVLPRPYTSPIERTAARR